MRDTEFSFCTGSHNHIVGSAEDFSVPQMELCASFLPIKAKKHYISATIFLNYGKGRSNRWLFKKTPGKSFLSSQELSSKSNSLTRIIKIFFKVCFFFNAIALF